jgi:hypothetical protein
MRIAYTGGFLITEERLGYAVQNRWTFLSDRIVLPGIIVLAILAFGSDSCCEIHLNAEKR